jgi:hypothetical protein
MQKYLLLTLILSPVLANSALAKEPTHKGTHHNGKGTMLTCEAFVALAEVEKPKVVYLSEALDRKGNPEGMVIDVAMTDRLVPVSVETCKKDPKQTLASAVRSAKASETKAMVKPNAKPTTASKSPEPAKMTCKEFLAVEDVVQPNLVFWVEGIHRRGKPDEMVVDVARTDRLVPVVVDVCKSKPTASFWQTVKDELNKAL